jgi:hypothetical protein
MRKWMVGGLALLCAGLVGCPGAGEVPVSGTVTFADGSPVSNALVSFHPDGEKTSGLGGHGQTGADGKYVLVAARGEKGIAAGEYKVTISRRLRPDGSPADPNVPPAESDARESLPEKYHLLRAAILRVTVSKEQPVHDFSLTVKKPK